MNNTEYLPASEIAQKAGITRQTVHNRAKGKWKQYAKEIDGMLYVSVKALSNDSLQLDKAIDGNLTAEFDKNLTEDCQTDCKIDNAEMSNPVSNLDKTLSNEWTAVVNELKIALEDKKQEIDRLRADLASERTRSSDLERRLLEYAERFADMAEREQELTRNAQQLHAIAEVRNDTPEISEPEEQHGIMGWLRRKPGKGRR